MLAAVGQGRRAQHNAYEAKLGTFEGLVLCLKKQVAAQPPAVGALECVARGPGISNAFAGDRTSKGVMTCFPKTAAREGAQWLSCSTCTEEVKFGNTRKDLS